MGVYLKTACFTHGQLYVAASRVGHPAHIKFALAPDDDGTQFWPRSHRDEAAPDRASTLAADAEAMSAMVSPGCPAGGMLSFDYRVVHRGLANERRERAVAYFVVALAAGVEDSHNFPDVGVRDATPEHAAAMPFWDAEGRVAYSSDQI